MLIDVDSCTINGSRGSNAGICSGARYDVDYWISNCSTSRFFNCDYWACDAKVCVVPEDDG